MPVHPPPDRGAVPPESDPHTVRPDPERGRDVAHARLTADVVGYAAGLPATDILPPRRGSRAVCASRQLVMYLLAGVFTMSHARISGAMGRDRSTVSHAIRLVESRRANPQFDRWVEALEEMLRAAPEPPERAPVAASEADLWGRP